MINNAFHDNEYDGIIIKIPSWFVTINKEKIGPMVESIHKALADELLLSRHHPDIKKSLYELENIDEKKEIVSKIKERQLEINGAFEKRNEKLLSKEILPIEWHHGNSYANSDDLNIPLNDGSELHWDQEHLVTPKGNQKAEAWRGWNKISDRLNLKLFVNRNGLMELISFVSEIPEGFNWNEYLKITGFSVGYSWNTTVKYKIIRVQEYIRRSHKGLHYRTGILKFRNGELCYESDGEIKSLSSYEFTGNEFIKKKE